MTRKLAEYIITFFCIITLNFFLPRLMPGDPFTFISSEAGDVTVTFTDEQIERYKEYYGLDKPISVQYVHYICNMLKGYIGYSIYYNEDVLVILLKRVVWTIPLVLVSLLLSCVMATLLGTLSAWYRDRMLDRVLYPLMICFSEIPAFLTGLLLLFAGGAWMGWFPLSGGMSMFAVYPSSFHKIMDIIHHAVLPVLALVLSRLGPFYLLSRNSMLTVLSKDYMRTARGKGLLTRRILFRHALKNASIPVITRVFLSLASVFGGAVLVENVFNYPGIGKLMREAVMVRDYVLIQGILVFIAVTVLTMNLAADIIYKKLDPRVQ